MSYSRHVQKEMAAKVTTRIYNHEVARFVNMNEPQMNRRLSKMKNPVKLEAFRQVMLQAKRDGLHFDFSLIKRAKEARDYFYAKPA